MPVHTDFRDAIDEVYRVFAQYAAPTQLVASSVEDPSALLKALSSAPLRELSAENLGNYAASALYTVGRLEDYKHFLPRILELALEPCGWFGVDPPIIATHLVYAVWRSWPSNEQGAVLRVYYAAWQAALAVHPDTDVQACEWLCGLAVLGEDIQPLLRNWFAEPAPYAKLQAAWFLWSAPGFFLGRRRDAAYWAWVGDEAWAHATSWTYSTLVREALTVLAQEVGDNDRWFVDQALAKLIPTSSSLH